MAKIKVAPETNLQKVRSRIKSDSNYSLMRKEFSRMRSAVEKRMNRSMEAGLLERKVEIPTLEQIGSDRVNFAYEYSKLSKLYTSGGLGVKEMRKAQEKRVQSFQKLGYSFVTDENQLQFGRFMGYMVEKYSQETPDGKKMLLDSDIIVEGFDYVAERTKSQNHATISRLFNDYLRQEGLL